MLVCVEFSVDLLCLMCMVASFGICVRAGLMTC